MNRYLPRLLIATAVSVWLLLAGGCGYSSDTRSRGDNGYFSGDYWYDPYYGSSCCRGGTIVVPPAGHRPAPGQHPPGGRPPAQLPARPRPVPGSQTR